jgi:uncharacterized protein (DUF1919 family)
MCISKLVKGPLGIISQESVDRKNKVNQTVGCTCHAFLFIHLYIYIKYIKNILYTLKKKLSPSHLNLH